MLVRAFRLTDKLTNALLRGVIWIGESLLSQMYQLRTSFANFILTTWFVATQTWRTGRSAYATSAEQRRAIMARRAEELATRTIVREDPLKSQNRALSLFTVLLLAVLIGIVLWTTGSTQANRPGPPRVGEAQLPLMPTLPTATLAPTRTPTATPIPDPLRIGGSIVYALRENGRENLWAVGIGQTAYPIRLTNAPADDRDPTWSPDGTRIAFASRRDGNWDLYMMEVATGQVTRLTYSLAYAAAPVWSPDGAFIAYEGYENGNLDIYIIPTDGSATEPYRVTYDPAPDFSPAWDPSGAGRNIAYISLRDGNAEIYIINLDRPIEDEALRLTNTPGIDEDYPAWSPDGRQIAYSALTNGIELVYVKSVENPAAEPVIIGQGRQPTWAPDGASLLFALEREKTTTFVGGLPSGVGVSALAFSVPARASRPDWSSAMLPDSLIQSGGAPLENEPPLYVENVESSGDDSPPVKLRRLNDVQAPIAALSDRVDDSFTALREAVARKTGTDFLGTLSDAMWSFDRLPEPGQPRENWHYTGRAIAFDRNLVFNSPSPIEVVREDLGVNTFWRVYVRVDDSQQSGQLGEPLKRIPWDIPSRTTTSDPLVFEQGGRLKAAVPVGYYVDLTQLAEDYGWERLPALRDWRSNFPSLRYWQFVKRDNLAWNEAMFELFTQEQVDAFLFGPTPVPTRPPSPTETPGARRSPTPVPPDLG